MDIALFHSEDCPNGQVADERMRVIAAGRADIRRPRHLVETWRRQSTQFHGSPGILVDGVDVFAEPGSEVGLSCRRYLTPTDTRARRRSSSHVTVLADA